ncbi:MAG TPA: hypothetical protein VFI31_10715 [Pirellulales bacterium]|nr:hypothetical protein [Pirellulales bacterium]
MSPPDLTDINRGVVVQKPKADVYTWLLLVALLAIIMAVICLWIEFGVRYGADINATGATAPTAAIENHGGWERLA